MKFHFSITILMKIWMQFHHFRLDTFLCHSEYGIDERNGFYPTSKSFSRFLKDFGTGPHPRLKMEFILNDC